MDFYVKLFSIIFYRVFIHKIQGIFITHYRVSLLSYQNGITDLFLFSYYIFMRGYYRVSTSVFISYFRLRKMTSRLGNDDGHRDGD